MDRLKDKNLTISNIYMLSTAIQVWLLKLYLIEETALESLVHVLCEVGRGNEDAIQLFYLLKDDILNTVSHLLNGSFRPHLTLADDGISLVEKQDGCLG